MSASGGKLGHGSDKRVLDFTKDHPQGLKPRRDDDPSSGRQLPRAPTILEYAPKHVRERLDPRTADPHNPPRVPPQEQPPERRGRDEEEEKRYDAPLVPDVPHDDAADDDTPRDAMRAEAAWDRDDAPADEPHDLDDDIPEAPAPRRANDETTYDENLAELAALLESIRHDNTPAAPPLSPQDEEHDDADVPPPWRGAAREEELHIDGLRVPRSLAPTFMQPPSPPLPAYGSSPLKIVVGTGIASLFAAALAWLIVGDWYAPAPQAAAPLLHAQARERSAANVDPPARQDAARGARLASAPASYEIASAAPAPAPAATPPPPPASASHTVATVRVAPSPTDARGGPAPIVPPPAAMLPPAIPPQATSLPPQPAPIAPQASVTPPQAKPAPPPAAASAAPRMDAQEMELLLKQGKDFVAVGDLATARTVLARVADADVAAGALALAETYDPATLARLGVRGMQGDAEQARRWYARAQELGSAEATRHLALMAESTP